MIPIQAKTRVKSPVCQPRMAAMTRNDGLTFTGMSKSLNEITPISWSPSKALGEILLAP